MTTFVPANPDDSAFGIGSDHVAPMGALCDETATDSVDEGDVGIVRMTADRKLLARVVGSTDANRLEVQSDGSIKTHITDGTDDATVRDVTGAKALDVAIVDASGNQITTFGSSPGSGDGPPETFADSFSGTGTGTTHTLSTGLEARSFAFVLTATGGASTWQFKLEFSSDGGTTWTDTTTYTNVNAPAGITIPVTPQIPAVHFRCLLSSVDAGGLDVSLLASPRELPDRQTWGEIIDFYPPNPREVTGKVLLGFTNEDQTNLVSQGDGAFCPIAVTRTGWPIVGGLDTNDDTAYYPIPLSPGGLSVPVLFPSRVVNGSQLLAVSDVVTIDLNDDPASVAGGRANGYLGIYLFDNGAAWVGDVIFEGAGRNDGSEEYFPMFAISNTGIPTATASGSGLWQVPVGGLRRFRVRCTAHTSGELDVFYTASPTSGSFREALNALDNIDTGTPLPVAGYPLGDGTTALYTYLNGSGVALDIGSLPNSQNDGTFTASGQTSFNSGVTYEKYYSLQVKGTGAGATSWTVALEGSNNNANWTAILTHATADLDGTTKATTTPFPVQYLRINCSAVVLGGASNIHWYAVATA